MSRAGTWMKMLGVGIVICVGGPAFVQYIRPTDEELFKRYNPDLQKRSLEEGDRRAREFDEYVTRLKQWSKSDKSIWYAAQEQQEQKRVEAEVQRNQARDDAKAEDSLETKIRRCAAGTDLEKREPLETTLSDSAQSYACHGRT
ncbi:assembly factor cbp4 [Aspergillus luchuensis]|uniref:Cytochrome b mRNA-processing protein 4 n=1 Tax=Aspergillus kawachii TaxID=1069201 RepID=A0A146EYE2_ASPKA|nr:assembly factor cbp4 [Aspergillus luchuensis]